jgi:hypothetical protein
MGNPGIGAGNLHPALRRCQDSAHGIYAADNAGGVQRYQVDNL